MNDEVLMQRCIDLAGLGRGYVSPNPMVGALLVHEGKVIGEGYHQKYGEAHAEVNCVKDAIDRGAGDLISRSVMYVSLEPCAHHGKTPPCVDLIIKHQIPEVKIGCVDPFARVDGKGIRKLQEAGIKTSVGILEDECRELNRRFFTFHKEKRPYIILKWAETANGRIGYATGKRLMITNEETQRLVHKWRSEESAIMVGTNTALMDDPQLTNRCWSGPSPVRIVLDLNMRLASELKLFNSNARTIIINYLKEENKGHISYLKIERDDNILPSLMQALYRINIQSVIVEGGTTLLQSLIDENLWDEARVFRNDKMIIEGGILAPRLERAEWKKNERGWEYLRRK